MKVITKDVFSNKVLDMMVGSEAEFMDAILTVCHEMGIEVDQCAPFLTDKLVSLLEMEAKKMNLIKNTDKQKHSVFY